MRRPLQWWVKSHTNNIARITIVVAFLILAWWAITLENNNLVIGYSSFDRWLTTALKNVGPELAGIGIGIVTIDYLNERRQEEQLKKQLILQLGSSHNDVTDTALRALMAYGWLSDGTLTGVYLSRANLENADLWVANLENADLWKVNLKNANLAEVNLKNTDLSQANLKHASLLDVNLEKTDLSQANLKNASLVGVNLKNANLAEVNLKNAYLEVSLENANLVGANLENVRNWTEEQLLQARSLEGAIMPDGTKLKDTGRRPFPLSSEKPNDGPTLDEWLAMQKDQVDEQALAEVDALLAAEQNFEEE